MLADYEIINDLAPLLPMKQNKRYVCLVATILLRGDSISTHHQTMIPRHLCSLDAAFPWIRASGGET